MTMKIKFDWPPNIDSIREVLDISGDQPVFTYGDTIYNPYRHDLDAGLIAHEEVHERQQAAVTPVVWWEMYLSDPEFRADQEIKAYRKQFKVYKRTYKRDWVEGWLEGTAASLCGKMYGGCVDSKQAAIARITR